MGNRLACRKNDAKHNDDDNAICLSRIPLSQRFHRWIMYIDHGSLFVLGYFYAEQKQLADEKTSTKTAAHTSHDNTQLCDVKLDFTKHLIECKTTIQLYDIKPSNRLVIDVYSSAYWLSPEWVSQTNYTLAAMIIQSAKLIDRSTNRAHNPFKRFLKEEFERVKHTFP
jgi:hypothetical protein